MTCEAELHGLVTRMVYSVLSLIGKRTKDGNPSLRYIISKAALEGVYDRLCKRLQHFQSSHAGFQLTSKYTAHFKHVFLHGKGTFTAGSTLMLMPAIIFVLLDLLTPELEIIRCEISGQNRIKARTTQSSGSLERYCRGVEQISTTARRILFPLLEAPALQKKVRLMKEELK